MYKNINKYIQISIPFLFAAAIKVAFGFPCLSTDINPLFVWVPEPKHVAPDALSVTPYQFVGFVEYLPTKFLSKIVFQSCVHMIFYKFA